jgi:hypothetical protein
MACSEHHPNSISGMLVPLVDRQTGSLTYIVAQDECDRLEDAAGARLGKRQVRAAAYVRTKGASPRNVRYKKGHCSRLLNGHASDP